MAIRFKGRNTQSSILLNKSQVDKLGRIYKYICLPTPMVQIFTLILTHVNPLFSRSVTDYLSRVELCDSSEYLSTRVQAANAQLRQVCVCQSEECFHVNLPCKTQSFSLKEFTLMIATYIPGHSSDIEQLSAIKFRTI